MLDVDPEDWSQRTGESDLRPVDGAIVLGDGPGWEVRGHADAQHTGLLNVLREHGEQVLGLALRFIRLRRRGLLRGGRGLIGLVGVPRRAAGRQADESQTCEDRYRLR